MENIKSPCVLICSIEQNSGHCYGCGRTREEIAEWIDFTPEQRTRLMADVLPSRISKLERRPRRVTKRARQRNAATQRDVLEITSNSKI